MTRHYHKSRAETEAPKRETHIFTGLARVETFRKDVARMDKAVRVNLDVGDPMQELQDAWDRLRPWLDCVNPNPRSKRD